MTRDQVLSAIEVSAQERVSKLFDVLCTEMASSRDDYKTEAVGRFVAGVRNIRQAAVTAISAIPEEGES